MKELIERRKHIRVYFEEPMVPVGTVELGDGPAPEVLPCIIWGLSAGGVRLSIKEKREIATGDLVSLSRIQAAMMDSNIPEDDQILLQVGWSMYQTNSKKTYLGCRVLELPDSQQKVFSELIHYGMEENKAKL